jgi:ankyrin repeat protein
MSPRDLPARPNLDHLKNEAKALHKAVQDGNAAAIERVHATLGDQKTLKLTDAQRVIAREYGFPSWARLRSHVAASRGSDEAITAFLRAVQFQDVGSAKQALDAEPRIASESLHVAAVLGRADDAERLIREDSSRVRERVGNPAADPLLFLCFSPFHGESAERDAALLKTARLLLDAGADPNTVDGQYGVPALYAVTGARSVLPMARLLIDAGANPTDGESVFHAAENFHEEALELLLSAGADLNYVGDWGNTALYFLLRWHDVGREETVNKGFRWLLDHGADPNVVCGKERENSLHIAVRRGQSAGVVEDLLDHGADVSARSGDGSTAWQLARRYGFDELVSILDRAGAEHVELSPRDRLVEACSRGDVAEARRLTSPELIASLSDLDRELLFEAASHRSSAIVEACVAAGFPIDATDSNGATALHLGAIRGRTAVVRALLVADADFTITDPQHSSTPLGWAFFGADVVRDANGDYEGTVRALLEAGARPRGKEQAAHDGVRGVMKEFGVLD